MPHPHAATPEGAQGKGLTARLAYVDEAEQLRSFLAANLEPTAPRKRMSADELVEDLKKQSARDTMELVLFQRDGTTR